MASTFDSGPIACSSLLSRTSLEAGHSIHSEFAVPKKPVLRQKLRGGAKEQHVGTGTTESSTLDVPDSTESLEDAAKETESVVKVIRKRGRKPKIPDVIRESSDSSSSSTAAATPPKKGRRGRPPVDRTPEKKKPEVMITPVEAEKDEESVKPLPEKSDTVPEKSSDECLKEAEEEWDHLKSRSYEIGKAGILKFF